MQGMVIYKLKSVKHVSTCLKLIIGYPASCSMCLQKKSQSNFIKKPYIPRKSQQRGEDDDDKKVEYEEIVIDMEKAVQQLQEFEGPEVESKPKRRRQLRQPIMRWRLKASESAEQIQYTIRDRRLDSKSIAVAFIRLAQIMDKDADLDEVKQLVNVLSKATKRNLTKFDGRGFGAVLCAYGRVGDMSGHESLLELIKHEIITRCQNKSADMNPQTLAYILRGLALMGDYDRKIFTVIAQALSLASDTYFDPQAIPPILNAYAKFQHQDAYLFEMLLSKSFASGYKYCSTELVQLAVSSARLNHPHSGFLNEASKYIVKTSNEAECSHLSNMLWGLASLGIQNHSMILAVCQQLKSRAMDFEASQLSQISWALAQFGYSEDNETLEAICQRGKEVVKKFKLSELCVTLWAITKLRFHDEEFFEACAVRLIAKMDDMQPEGICQTAWAFSKCRHQHKELFQALADMAQVSLVRKFDLLQYNTVVWAFSNIKFYDKRLFDAIARNSIHRLSEFDAAHLATFAKGFSQVKHEDLVFLRALVGEAKRREREFNTKQLSDIVVGSVTMGYNDVDLLSLATSRISNVLGNVPVSVLPKILTSYANCKFYDKNMIRGSCQRLLSMPLRHLNGLWFSQVLYPLALLGREGENEYTVFKHLQRSSRKSVSRFPDATSLARCAWAMGCQESLWDQGWWESISLAFYDVGRENFRKEELLLTAQTYILHSIFCQHPMDRVLTIPQEIVDASLSYLKNENSQRQHEFGEQLEELERIVKDLGFKCRPQQFIDNTNIANVCFSADLIISDTREQQSIAIMLDGDESFCANYRQRPTGQLRVRNTIIQKLGHFLKVIQLNGNLWQQLDREKKIIYLEQQLRELQIDFLEENNSNLREAQIQ